MTTHYLRLRPFLADHAIRHGADDERWAEEVFNDLTENGHVLTTVPLPDGPKGPVLGLCGDRFFGEVCRDERRSDCLFLFKLWKADDKLPTVEPSRHEVGVRLLFNSDADNPILDSIDALLPPIPNESPEVGLLPLPSRAAFVEPSPALFTVLRSLDRDSIRRLCPGAPENIDENARKSWKEKLRVLRMRFGLEITARLEGILNGSITPKEVDRELRTIGEDFDVTFLNGLGNDEQRKALLQELLEIPAGAEATRRTLWLSWLSEQGPSTMKEELHAVASRLASADRESDSRLNDFLLKTLQKVGEQYNDDSLLALKEKTVDSDTPWSVVADWASQLVVREMALSHPDDAADVIGPVEGEPIREADQATSDTINESKTDIHLALEISPLERPATPESGYDTLVSWVIAERLQLRTIAEATGIKRKADQVLTAFRAETLQIDSLDALRNALSDLQNASTTALNVIPTSTEMSSLTKEADRLVHVLRQKLDRNPLPFLDQNVRLDALRKVANSETLISIIGALPDWAAPPPSEGLPEDSTDRILIECLRDGEFLQDIERLGEKLMPSGEDLGKLLGLLSPPSSGLDPFHYLIEWARQAAGVLDEIKNLNGPAANWTMQTLASWCQPQDALEIAYRLESLAGQVSSAVITAITEMVESATDAGSHLDALYEAELTVGKIEELFTGAAATFTTDQWNRARDGVKNEVAASPRGAAVRTRKNLSIEHNLVDETARRVGVTYVPYDDPGRPYGFVTVPLCLQAPTPMNVDLELELNVTTNQRAAWPSEWECPEPRSLHVRSDEWRKVDEHFQRAFHATIPIRNPSDASQRRKYDRTLRIEFEASESGENLLSGGTKSLSWDQLQIFKNMPELNWPDTVVPNYVKDHPVGGQARAQALLDRLRQGNSFAMLAPRRFGKSTLIGYIAREADELIDDKKYKLLVLPPLVCTSYPGEGRAEMWEDVHRRLVEKIGVGFTTNEPGNVPSPEAIKQARETAWQNHYKSIILLFDEAQLFFAGQDGCDVGDQLKDMLEGAWTCKSEEGLASVQIGLVGIPSLRDRAGDNLMAALQAVESDECTPPQLNRILLAVSQERIQTTRAARQELARHAGNNLFILKTMVQRIHDQLKEERRLWFNDRDVVDAFSNARQSLENGYDRGIGHYLRDSLNEADSVNEWQPKHCYPLAVALANVGQKAQSERRIDLAVGAVRRWCANLSAGEVAFKYTEERSKEDLQALGELGVYKDEDGFRSELLEGYLRYMAKDHFPKNEDKQAITRCGVERIRKPASLEPITTGGQAEIYRFNKDSTTCAWRQIKLPNPHAHEVFLMTQEALHKLRDLRYEEGSKYFYDLRQVGISEDGHGVEVYRWIDGISLDEQAGTFSKEAVVDVGVKIGQAIELIHRNNVLHRDISPRNIILTDDLVPVLVDFGLARAASREMNTVVGGEYAPPEVRGDSPKWTKAADIYGFGVTLRKLLKPGMGGMDELQGVLDRCCSPDPTPRPDAGELLRELENIRKSLHVQEIRETAWQKIEAAVEEAGGDQKFRNLLLKFRPQFEGIAIGLYPDRIDLCAEVAVLLDQTLEAFSGSNEDLKLGSIKHKGLRGVETGSGVEFAHLLRREKSHFFSDGWREKKLRKFCTSDDQMRTLMIEAAGQIGQGLNLPRLVKVIETTLASPSTRRWDT